MISEAPTSCSSAQEDTPVRVQEVRNPGSKDHPLGCKPCNKFNPARPADSCKHGDECDFCHKEHERPKHRGQRGRHALQRRQYLESRAEQPQYLRDLIDDIYRRPHECMDKIKRELQNLTSYERDDKVRYVLAGIRRIGTEAQEARPDHNRLRGAIAGPECETVCSIAELDGRCKWLVGTLHLMVRKMYETKEPQDSIDQIVKTVLNKCDALYEEVKNDIRAGSPGASEVDLPARFRSLQPKVSELCGQDPTEIRQFLEQCQGDFKDLQETTASMNAKELERLNDYLASSTTLDEMRERLKTIEQSEVLQEYQARRRDELFNAESLEDIGLVSSHYNVQWKGAAFTITLIIGSVAQMLREKIAEKLTEGFPSQAESPHLEAPSIHASQVRLGVVGLAVELDYNQAVPEAVKDHLKVRVVRKYWEDIVNTWPTDSAQPQKLIKLIRTWIGSHGHVKDSWASSTEFCRVVGIIDMLLRRFKRCDDKLEVLVKLVENVTAVEDSKPATLLNAIHDCKDFSLDSVQLIQFYHLLGESDDCLHMKLDRPCKFLDTIISRLTLERLPRVQTEEDLRRLQLTQIQIQDECESLPSTLDLLSPRDVEDVKEKLSITPATPVELLEMLRKVVRQGSLGSS